MNKQIESLDFNKIIAVDIETVRGKEVFDEKDENFNVWAWKCRDRETNVIPDNKSLIEQYHNKAALSAEWGKIVCISVGYVSDNKIVTKSFTGDETSILREAIDTINKSGRVMLCHNGVFDIPYMRKRFFINGMKGYLNSTDVGIKPWETDNFLFDTMVFWKGIGWAPTSLEELAMCMNVPTPKGDMHGNEVGDYFYNGKIDKIAKYCEGDVATVLNIIRRWRGEDILEAESKTEIEIKSTDNMLQQLIDQDSFSAVFKAWLEETTKDMEDAELHNVKELVTAHYLKPKVKKAIQEDRIAEVDQLFHELKEKRKK